MSFYDDNLIEIDGRKLFNVIYSTIKGEEIAALEASINSDTKTTLPNGHRHNNQNYIDI